jgi:salicylate hydroxylase
MADVRVAVVGGGIGGLTLAIALRERGVPVEVFEQAPDLREVGAAVALSANGTRLLRRLGIDESLGAVSVEPSELVIRRWHDGEILAAHPMAQWYRDTFGAPFYGLHRADLQRVLSERLGTDVLRLGHRCVGLANEPDGVKLDFAGGETARADVAVGADGVHSEVRRLAMGAEPAVFSGTTGFRGLVSVDRLPSLPDPSPLQFWAGPGRHLLHYSIAGGTIINFLAVVRQPEWTKDAWVESCEVEETIEAYQGWHPAVTEMLGAVEEASRWALHDHAPLTRWSVGRVVLLGDAAHAMLPHQGQGANQTIEDAVALADCLAEARPADLPTALDRYEAGRRPRTRMVQRYSRLAADCLHLPDGSATERRNASLAGLPTHLAWIHRHDVQGASAGDGLPGDDPGWAIDLEEAIAAEGAR